MGLAQLRRPECSGDPTLPNPLVENLSKDLLVPHSFKSSLEGISVSSQDMHVNGVTIEPPTRLQQLDIDVHFTTSSRRSNCTWAGCQQTADKHDELKAHLESHSLEARALWTSGSKCTWQGCKSKAVFKLVSQLKQHLTNIHSNPLLCNQPRCPYRKPFKNHHDLDRHTSTKHSVERKWECPYDTCSSDIRTFIRKDKWLKHIREVQHENDAFCPFYHCSLIADQSGKGFQSRKEIVKHFLDAHAGKDDCAFECALGSCEKTSNHDRWNVSWLRCHLRQEHDLRVWYQLEHTLKGTGGIFRLQNLHPYDHRKWVDCKICATQTDSPVNTTGPPSSLSGTF